MSYPPHLLTIIRLRLMLLAAVLWVATVAGAQPITNAAPEEEQAIEALFEQLDEALAARDITSLQFLGIAQLPSQIETIEPQTRLSHIAVSSSGALVRQAYRIVGRDQYGAPVTLGEGVHDLGLTRLKDGGFAFTARRWAAPPDARTSMAAAARDEWNATQSRVVAGPTSLVAGQPATVDRSTQPVILHLVAERRGGRWIALRRSRWNGAVLDSAALKATAEAAPESTPDASAWLKTALEKLPDGMAGQAHFILQSDASGWVGLETVWDAAPPRPQSDEAIVAQQRVQLAGHSYLSAQAHRDFALRLREAGLFAEAGDHLEMADHLQPGLVGEARLQQARLERAHDPAEQSVVQLQKEARIGLDADHPAYIIETQGREFQAHPTPLRALRIGIEYSKLAEEELAAQWLARAEEMMKHGALAQSSANDVAWVNVLHGHLRERQRLLSWKPANVIRSALFTVRCYSNDRNVPTLLAALEAAQHTVYAGFGIPMGNTEVVLWKSQSEFQRYTVQFSPQASSELVAAMTLTKLMTTQSGPLVLGEEINAFVDPRADFFGTVAHEYGHVAVRHLSRGRSVPVWFNEGIAAAVEGGYEGYKERVREAAQRRRLLSMAEMQTWNVDGERAFLAYSQANSMIDYIVARRGHEAVLEILRQIGRDISPDTAFARVLGVSQQALWSSWAQQGIR